MIGVALVHPLWWVVRRSARMLAAFAVLAVALGGLLTAPAAAAAPAAPAGPAAARDAVAPAVERLAPAGDAPVAQSPVQQSPAQQSSVQQVPGQRPSALVAQVEAGPVAAGADQLPLPVGRFVAGPGERAPPPF